MSRLVSENHRGHGNIRAPFTGIFYVSHKGAYALSDGGWDPSHSLRFERPQAFKDAKLSFRGGGSENPLLRCEHENSLEHIYELCNMVCKGPAGAGKRDINIIDWDDATIKFSHRIFVVSSLLPLAKSLSSLSFDPERDRRQKGIFGVGVSLLE